ncbi:MAG: hypothetical protein JSS27_05635 [Planctomycetes bacterium]|nr:hypothetical protein [Planctomycetota bacterium]
MSSVIDDRANERVRGAAWDKIRPQLTAILDTIATATPTAFGELTTIYVKFTTPESGLQPFAVLWIKKSTELVLGLALPEGFDLGSQPVAKTNLKYNGLTAYFKFTAADEVPRQLGEWLGIAYRNRLPK